MASNLEDVIAEVADRGFRLASLFEKPVFAGKGWHCSLAPATDDKAKWINGTGPTPSKAIAKALQAARPTRRFTDLEDIL